MEPRVYGHPRIHICNETIEGLKKKAAATHKLHYRRLIAAADEVVKQKLPDRFGGGPEFRRYGDELPVLAMAYLLCGREEYLDFTRQVLSRLMAIPKWGDDLDLVTGHFMSGAAIAYDWLHGHLPNDERRALADKIAHHAEILYRYASQERVWWHDFFLHNWNFVITGGLAYAAAALAGENRRAGDWSDYAERMFSKVEEALPEDGSYQEGFAYMTYGWECLVRYFDLARQLYGRDHFRARWLREAPYLLLYFSAPKLRPHDNCMMFGDGPRHFEWHGPVHLMYRSAGEYEDGVIQGFAKELVDSGVGLTRTGTWLNMLWYNPTVKAKPYRELPTARIFPNLDVFSARSGWDENAVMVGFKCTNNAGKKAMQGWPGRDLGSGHAHPDAGSFQVYAFGEWLAVDTGYTQYKETKDHNTVVVNGVQQLGGERMWFDVNECFMNGGIAEITHCISSAEYDYVRGDATKIYRPQAGLEKFIRHFVFIKPADILVVDELEGRAPSAFEWRLHADEKIAKEGAAWVVKKGKARLRVAFLAPKDMRGEVTTSHLDVHGDAGMAEAVVLSAQPAKKVKATTIVTFISAYRGEKAKTQASLVSLKGGVLTLRLKGGKKPRTLTLDMAGGRVEII